MKQISKFVLVLITPLIVLSGNGVILFQHHCNMENRTSYSLPGLIETNTCCSFRNLHHGNVPKDRHSAFEESLSCCSSFTLFLKTADFHDGGTSYRIVPPDYSNCIANTNTELLPIHTSFFHSSDKTISPGKQVSLPLLGVFRL